MDAASVTGLLSGFLALFFLLLLKPLAVHVDLMDRPDHRKIHSGAVPLVGGLSAFLGLCVTWLLEMPLSDGYGLFLACAALLVLMGAVDDACDLPANFRLGSQIALGAALAYGSGISLDSFGNLLGFGVIELGPLGPIVTIAAIIAATNAFNMVDGIDGLTGSLSLVALLSLCWLFSASGRFPLELTFCLALAFGLAPYLMANLRIFPFKRKIFMGDAGSMFVGFAVVWLLVQGTDLERSAFRPVTALWLVAIPLMDMVAIMVRRARKSIGHDARSGPPPSYLSQSRAY